MDISGTDAAYTRGSHIYQGFTHTGMIGSPEDKGRTALGSGSSGSRRYSRGVG